MILIFDKRSTLPEQNWEQVDWNILNPDDDDDEQDDAAYTIAVKDHDDVEAVGTSAEQPPERFAVVVTPRTPKSDLKKILQTSFTIAWIKGALRWPKRFTPSQKGRLPLDRAILEMRRALKVYLFLFIFIYFYLFLFIFIYFYYYYFLLFVLKSILGQAE
jgi:hypothetical protein